MTIFTDNQTFCHILLFTFTTVKKIVKMKSLKKFLLFLFVSATLLTVTSTYSQNYKQAIGLRGGVYSGVNYKNFFGNSTAFEVLLLRPWKAFEMTLLVEYHIPMDRNRNFFLYYGAGAHTGLYNSRYTKSSFVYGGDLIVGFEYEFKRIPVAFGIDWKPFYNFAGTKGFFTDGGALSFRYTFH